MRGNVVYAHYQGGFAQVGTSPGIGIVMVLNLPGDSGEVVAKGLAEIATYEDGQTEVTVGIAPNDAGPGVTWFPGDLVTVDNVGQVQCAAQTFTVDNDTDVLTCVPQFGVVLDEPTQRIDRNFAAYGGLAKGTSHLARPVQNLQRSDVRPG